MENQIENSAEGVANSEAPLSTLTQGESPATEPQNQDSANPGEESLAGESLSPALFEALLIAAGTGLTLDELSTTTGAEEESIEQVLKQLSERYESDDSGIELKKVAGRYQIRTKEQFATIIRKLKTETPRRLTAQALETLAIIAYRQPVARSEVEKLRGVDVSPTIKTLLERGLIRIVGTQPTPGSPALFGTTEEFLKVFGLDSLEQLPSIRDLHELSKEPGEQVQATEQ